MINDKFIVDEDIEVAVTIAGNDKLLTIEVAITNKSAERVMLDKHFLDWYPTSGKERSAASPNRPIGSHHITSSEVIDILNPGETMRFNIQRRYERDISHFLLFDLFGEDYNPLGKSQPVDIVIFYYSSIQDMREMQKLVSDAVVLPNFSRTYALAKVDQDG